MENISARRYRLINDITGWACFAIAAVSYLLTMEPTASFWDCPEYITQGYKLEVGHPPGNPIFMLAARFFANFAFGDVTKVAVAINTMSCLLSAATILLLFWTITHLAKRLIVSDSSESVSVARMAVIMGAGVCGALMYAWSDTFWFSAVEGEVYAFSSFCTALVVWLIFKWENRADDPASDRFLVLIAYIIGVSIAVHLLNLLCIPAIVLVIYYRKWTNCTAKGSLLALLIAVAIMALILYGLVPGFIEVAQWFELFFVNVVGLGYNMGVLIYAVVLIAAFIIALRAIYAAKSMTAIRITSFVAIALSGIALIGSSVWLPIILLGALAAWLWTAKKLPLRVLNIAVLSIFVIFIGYSSYALLLIRSSANPQMNQNTPDNVFTLASYLNREQYGETPLLFGQTYGASPVYTYDEQGNPVPMDEGGPALRAKAVKNSPDEPDRYVVTGYKKNYVYTPELNMLFPRIYSSQHVAGYQAWTGMTGEPVNGTLIVDRDGNVLQKAPKVKPTTGENLSFLLGYQLNHMYWRYFLWNFAGRQNDIQGNGEPNHGNWISGIPFIDNPRLGDQSLLPYEEGEGNKGNNKFYLIPLLMGIFGLIWQAFSSKRGIEQFWVVFFLFFMTGIAIVLYLNQTPGQVRERDYAYAGSFYAYAIWVGLGVCAIYKVLCDALKSNKKAKDANPDSTLLPAAVAACVVALFVPAQVVSQTWDDHDRSGRRTTTDFGMNYLNSLEPNAIIFTNGDNDTFPLWYAQEVEGVRRDVRVVNQSYLTTDWYANMLRHPYYEAKAVDMLAGPADYEYDRMQFAYFTENPDTTAVNALASLHQVYDPRSAQNSWGVPMMNYPVVYMPVDKEAAVAAGRLTAEEAAIADPAIVVDLYNNAPHRDGMALNNLLTLDMLATSMANGWDRPIYFAMTVPDEYYMGLNPYMRQTGMAYEINPVYAPMPDGYSINVSTDRAYANITEKFRWGGLDKAKPGSLYLDETVRKMVSTVRKSMIDLAKALAIEGYHADEISKKADTSADDRARAAAYSKERYEKARHILSLMEEKLPGEASPYAIQDRETVALIYDEIGTMLNTPADNAHAVELINEELDRYTRNLLYYQSLSPTQYSMLTRTDRYIDQTYFTSLLQLYAQLGGDAEKKMLQLQEQGVNFERQLRYMNREN